MTTDRVRDALNRGSPHTLADAAQAINLGQTLASDVKQTKRKVDMDAAGADPSSLATLDVLKLPDDAKASLIFRAYARAGTAGTGEMTVAARHATPVSGEIAVTPSGDIATLGADAITDVDVEYLGERGCVFEYEGDVAANVMALPQALIDRGVLVLSEAEALVGTATGDLVVLTPGGAPAAGQAALEADLEGVAFAAADAVTRARVKLVVVALKSLTDVLQGTAPPLI